MTTGREAPRYTRSWRSEQEAERNDVTGALRYLPTEAQREWLARAYNAGQPRTTDQVERVQRILSQADQMARRLAVYCPESPELARAFASLDVVVASAIMAIERHERGA